VNVFKAQSSYSSVPFHIKLIELPSSLLRPASAFYSSASDSSVYYARIREVALRFGSLIQGELVPMCRVDPTSGEVSLRIKSSDCLMLGRQLSSSIPGATDWYSKTEENLLVSIGMFQGGQKAQFEAWLNSELSGNKDLFPKFSATSIEFSEQWLSAGFPLQTIPLSLPVPVQGAGLRAFGSFEPFGSNSGGVEALGVGVGVGVGADSIGNI